MRLQKVRMEVTECRHTLLRCPLLQLAAGAVLASDDLLSMKSIKIVDPPDDKGEEEEEGVEEEEGGKGKALEQSLPAPRMAPAQAAEAQVGWVGWGL